MEQISKAIADGVMQDIAEKTGRQKRHSIDVEDERQARIQSRDPADHAERQAKRSAKLKRRAIAAGHAA